MVKIGILGIEIGLFIWMMTLGILCIKDKDFNEKRDNRRQLQVWIIMILNAIMTAIIAVI